MAREYGAEPTEGDAERPCQREARDHHQEALWSGERAEEGYENQRHYRDEHRADRFEHGGGIENVIACAKARDDEMPVRPFAPQHGRHNLPEDEIGQHAGCNKDFERNGQGGHAANETEKDRDGDNPADRDNDGPDVIARAA